MRPRKLHILFHAIIIACAWSLCFLGAMYYYNTPMVEEEQEYRPVQQQQQQQQLQIPPYPIRIASPVVGDGQSRSHVLSMQVIHSFYSARQRHVFMATHGETCHVGASHGYVDLTPVLQLELWKYCMLRLRVATVVWHPEEIALLVDHVALLALVQTGVVLVQHASSDDEAPPTMRMHSSFLQLQNAQLANRVTKRLVQTIVESSNQRHPEKQLSCFFAAANNTWSRLLSSSLSPQEPRLELWNLTCPVLDDIGSVPNHQGQPPQPNVCFLRNGYCCHAFIENATTRSTIALVRHPMYPRFVLEEPLDKDKTKTLLPNRTHASDLDKPTPCPLSSLESCVVVTWQQVRNRTGGLQPLDNFFDIMNRTGSLPRTKSCIKCLRKNGSCTTCQTKCRRYCSQLCRVRPPVKPQTQVWTVYPPKFRRYTDRLIPKLVHQVREAPIVDAICRCAVCVYSLFFFYFINDGTTCSTLDIF